MAEIKLPTLNKRSTKPKILLLSDDLRMHSGIGTMSREFVMGTIKDFDWVQLGAAIKHPEEGKVINLNQQVRNETGIKDASLKIYPSSGYGNPQVLRQLMNTERPNAILHFTDPRFWGWLYQMEHEVRQSIPIMYYTIWDDLPYPRWNEPFYESCDLLMGISKQTYNIVHNVIRKYPKKDWQIKYVPHGINENHFFPIKNKNKDEGFLNYKKSLLGKDYEFIAFYNNRNIRRKNPGDLILAYKTFCDMLPKEKAEKCCLLMHTHRVDENGTDLPAVKKEICPDYDIVFSDSKIDRQQMNWLYNMADVTVNIASNEGFGLSGAESLMCGTPIINNVTGGLQDQCGFSLDGKLLLEEDYREIASLHNDKEWENNPKLTYGKWVKPVWPKTRSLMGSPPTPYIFDDRCRFDDVADRLKEWYDEGDKNRKECGLKGRKYVLKEEVGMSAKNMCNRFSKNMSECLEKFEPRKRYQLYSV